MLRSGDHVVDRFRIEAPVAEGGMAVVYRATDLKNGRPVAVKCLRQAVYGDRFLREAKILADIDHPNVVRHLGHGRTASGDWYLAMEWLEGPTLRARLAGRPMVLEVAVELVRQAAMALGVAHARGVVHRDVKPENFVLIGDPPTVKLIDFGIARLADGLSTRTGTSMGTPEYMAPEQARGDKNVGPRADVFSLGCVLYECLIGRSPFRADSAMAVLARILLEEVRPLGESRPDIPPSLDVLCRSMLARDPALRPEHGEAVTRALSDALGQAPAAPIESRSDELAVRERRLVSVIFAASPRGLPRPDGEALGTMMPPPPEPEFLARAHGGRVERFVDGSYAVLLDGAAAEELARRAAACAAALVRRDPSRSLSVATGHAEVGGGAPPQGEVIDRALVPLFAAGGGPARVFVDEATAALLDAAWVVDRSGPRLRLGGLTTAPPSPGALRPSRFVGRERELAAIQGLGREAFAEPVARAVMILGEPGTGKSRLRSEASAAILALSPQARQWLERADVPRAGEPYGLAAALVRRVAGITPHEDPALVRAKLAGLCRARLPAERTPLVAATLAELVGVGADASDPTLQVASSSPVVMGELLRRGFAEWLAGEAAHGPVVLMLEDVHWADAPSLACVDAALARAAQKPLLVIATARPEVHERHPELFVERELETVRLGPLSRSAADRLVHQILPPGTGEDQVQRVVACGDGNPLFLEELARWITEGHSADFPPTTLALMEARLSRLDEPARRALRAASVFGRTFPAAGVAALLGDHNKHHVELEIEVMVRANLVRRRADAGPGDDELEFAHALAQEAAYLTLTDDDRRRGHRLAGAWLAEHGASDTRLLARHHELGGDRDRALAEYLKAARQALRGQDLDAVIECVDRALAARARAEVRGELLLMRAEALQWHGKNAPAVPVAREALLLLDHGSPAWCRAAGLCAILHGTLRDLEALRAVAGELEIVPVQQASEELWTALGRASTYLVFAGDLAASEALLARIGPDDSTLGRMNPLAAGWALTARSVVAWLRGDPGGALDISRRAAAMFERAGDRLSAAYGRSNLGYFFIVLGAHRAAELELRAALEVGRARGVDYVVASAAQNLGLALARLGEFDEAESLELESVRLFAAQNDVRMECGSRLYLADLRLGRGDLDRADADLRAMLAREDLPGTDRVGALALLAKAERLRGRVNEAVLAILSARELLAALGPIEEYGLRVELEAAETLAAAGEHEAADQAVARAAAEVDAQAALIGDPVLRQSYLGEVPEVRRVMELRARAAPRSAG
jgi:tetratricopeptide (TPR) repeat protein